MRGFILVFNGRAMPETFRFSQEGCKGITALWRDGKTGKYHDFKHWRNQGFRIKGAWLEVDAQ
uniref:hypothetical protein n=1 Tax=Caballeronia sp. LjRoot34 TaxID=3342325 RepID=UPI003F501910